MTPPTKQNPAVQGGNINPHFCECSKPATVCRNKEWRCVSCDQMETAQKRAGVKQKQDSGGIMGMFRDLETTPIVGASLAILDGWLKHKNLT